MARNGSGTHSTPNTFSSGTQIASSPINANFTDIASEITNSLPRDGQAGMTGAVGVAAGAGGKVNPVLGIMAGDETVECPKCTRVNPAKAKFCVGCGEQLRK